LSAGLLRRPQLASPEGAIHHITPHDAGWSYVGFDVLILRPGQTVSQPTGACEHCIVLIAGHVAIQVGGQDFGVIGGRSTPFDGCPWSAYVPPGTSWSVRAENTCELAVCSAPAKGGFPARLIPPGEVGQERRGTGTNERVVRNILPDTTWAEALLVVEVLTPGGHWSSPSYSGHGRDSAAGVA